MTRTLTFTPGVPSAVIPSSYRVTGGDEMFGTNTPWFSIRLGAALWTNRDPVWMFAGDSSRSLRNGGTETRLRFIGTAAARDLQWDVTIQSFPQSTLSRERILFRARAGARIAIGAAPGEPLLVFPAYRFRRGASGCVRDRVVSLAVWGNELATLDPEASFDDRSLESGTRIGKNLAQNYMYHPAATAAVAGPGDEIAGAGPVLLVDTLADGRGLFFAYEHGAPDRDPEQEYIHIRRIHREDEVEISTVYRAGLSGSGEYLGGDRYLASVWNVLGCYDARDAGAGPALMRDFLQDKITEAHHSRTPHFYYNTWGMQRDEERKGADVRNVLTPERVLREIELAKRMNVELFVLDDGWQERFGDWTPDHKRYPSGLTWYVDALRSRGMIPGIWIAPLATDPGTPLARAHPGWLIRDDQEKPIVGRWDKHIFCFASGYRDEFIAACKRLIDGGIRYFKWDGIDKHLCSSPGHGHGSLRQSADERRAMQGYALPLLIADAMRQLREYCPEVVVEMDVTEPGRSVGLAVLSEGKYFWMNNGAGAYGDHTTRRGKSTRFIPSLYHSYIPASLQTYACYPHHDPVHAAQRYNVNSALIAGWGFWGNLTTLTAGDIERIGEVVALARQTLPSVAARTPEVSGDVGGSPEIYVMVDDRSATGQIIGFSGTALEHRFARAGVRTDSVLAILRNAYEIHDDSVIIPFVFPMPESSREAFLVPNHGAGITILSSTSWLRTARLAGPDTLQFTPGAPGRHVIGWGSRRGVPLVVAGPEVRTRITKTPGADGAGEVYLVEIESTQPGSMIVVTRRK
ncbi:MAG: alpha-galactosidase [Ignavibacteriae bacterium]|nr:alpha-galactosidase [Ignavibacteriota bacterium]